MRKIFLLSLLTLVIISCKKDNMEPKENMTHQELLMDGVWELEQYEIHYLGTLQSTNTMTEVIQFTDYNRNNLTTGGIDPYHFTSDFTLDINGVMYTIIQLDIDLFTVKFPHPLAGVSAPLDAEFYYYYRKQ